MNKIITRDKVLLVVAVILIVFVALRRVYAAENMVTTLYSFNVEVDDDSGVAFQHTYILIVEVTSGILNGTTGRLGLTDAFGTFKLSPSNSCTIQLSTPDAPNGFRIIEQTGLTLTQTETPFVFAGTVTSGTNFVLRWGWNVESAVDQYLLLGIGLFGILMILYGGYNSGRTYLNHGISMKTVEALGWGMVWLIIGFGFVVVWLWR